MVTHINQVSAFVASFLVFHDRFTPFSLAGIITTIAGGVWYSKEQMNAKKAASPPPAEPPKADESTNLLYSKAEVAADKA